MSDTNRAGSRRLGAVALLSLLLLLPACGARGEPLPPFRPSPPALGGLTVAQRGGTAVLEFDPVLPVQPVSDGTVRIGSVELLLYAERYAAMTPEILATALERERFERLEQARAATEAAELAAAERQAQRRAEEEAAAAGEETAGIEEPGAEETEPPEEDEEETGLTENERLIRGVPDDVLSMWRESGLRGAVILESARRLDDTVDRLWDELDLPVAIIDTERPPALPDPVEIIEAAGAVAETVSYERRMPAAEFLGLAAPVRELSLEELQGEPPRDEEAEETAKATLEYGVGIPSSGPLRTRYYLAVRAVSGEGVEGALSDIASLAPSPVPVAPGPPVAEVVEEGIELSWRPSGGDVWGRLLDPEEIGYNVYRRLASEERFSRDPVNDEPLEEPELVDEEIVWGESYVYEVRALRRPRENGDSDSSAGDSDSSAEDSDSSTATEDTATSIRRESAAAASNEIAALDVFPPDAPRSPEALRTGSRVTLRWTPPRDDDDVTGYRIYRHPLPAPAIPGELLREEDREDDEDDAEGTTADEPAVDDPDAGEATAEDDVERTETASETEAAAETQAEETTPTGEEHQEDGDVDQQEEGIDQRPDHPDRVRRRVLRRLGFELLTERPVQSTRYVDTSADPASGHVYLIEALDDAGNVSRLARIEAPAPEDDG